MISPSDRAPDHGSKVLVVHMGTVYTAASPRYYLDALDELPEELRSRFETRFIGRISEEQAGVLISAGATSGCSALCRRRRR